MKTVIFGYPGSGKTELFLALTGNKFKNQSQGIVKVPEPRLIPLSEIFKPKKITFTEIEFVDYQINNNKITNKILGDLRKFDCLLIVIDAFSGFNDSEEQFREIEEEFILSDLSIVENRLKKIKSDSPELKKVKEILENGIPIRNDKSLRESPNLKNFNFLSAKPVIYIWNTAEENINSIKIPENNENEIHLSLSVKLEREMRDFDNEEDLKIFMEEFGIKESALDRVIKSTYNLLNLITFITAGEKEVRAWPLKKGSKAPDAGGVIHSDIKKGFIKAEVISFEEFMKYKSFKEAKNHGALRLEGKDYVVKDGDIITFYFNV